MFLAKIAFEEDTLLKVNYYECSETGDDLYTSSLSPGVLRPSIPRRHHLPGIRRWLESQASHCGDLPNTSFDLGTA